MYQINDSVNAQETKKQLNEMNTLFKVDELKMEKERAQFRNTMIIVGLIILALVIFSIFRYIAAKRLKVAHEKLQTTHEEPADGIRPVGGDDDRQGAYRE